MGVDCMAVSPSPEAFVVLHLSWVRKLPGGFASPVGMISFGGVVWHGSPLPPNGRLLFCIVTLVRDGGGGGGGGASPCWTCIE